MEKSKALELFIGKEVKDLSIAFVAEAMSHMGKEKKGEVTAQFCRELCMALGQAPSLRFLQISLVRLKALADRPFYCLEAYGTPFYLAEPFYEKELSLEWLYQAYKRFSDGIVGESRKYAGQIGKMELDRIALIELANCQKIMKFLFAETLPLLLQTQEYQALDRGKNIQFQLGESLGKYEILLVKDKNMERMEGIVNGILQAEAAQ